MGTKLVGLFANRVVERRNMINDYLREELALRVLGGVLILGFCFDFKFFLLFFVILLGFAAFCLFYWLCSFPSSR
jgi:hypothetical protein